MKRCASCGREIQESATVCDLCERWAADHIQVPATGAIDSRDPEPSIRASEPLSASWPAADTFTLPPAPPPTVPAPPIAPAPPPPKVAAAQAQSGKPALSQREMLIIVAALVVGGVVTFVMFGSRSGASTTVTAANRTPVAKTTAAPTPAPAPVRTQVWSSARRAYWTANQHHSVAFELPAENTVAIWMNYVRPILVVRCMNKRTESFIYTGSALKIEPNTEDHTVSFRFDNEAPHTERWPDSAEHDALFAPDGTAFAQRLLSAKSLRFGYTPHNAEPAEAQFQVDGIAELITPAAKDCGWQK